MVMQTQSKRSLRVSDVTGSRRLSLDIPDRDDATVGELIDSLMSRMASPTVDSAGRTLTYTLRSNMDGGTRLHRSQSVNELKDGDELVLQPDISAGAARAQ